MIRPGARALLALSVALALSVVAQPAGALLPSLGGVGVGVAEEPCRLIGAPTADPVGTGPCQGVRPGALVETPQGFCTLNFLFDGSDGRRYIGTAGHCILPDEGQEMSWAAGSGPVAKDASGNRIGEFAYAVFTEVKDFALIRIDQGVQANPGMCHFGGPTGMNRDTTTDPVALHHYGQGLALGETVPARTSLALTGTPSRDTVEAVGAVISGDSGSGVISSDGRAIGVVVTVGVHLGVVGGTPVVGDVGITRIGPQKDRAQDALGIVLSLRTTPQL